MKSKVHLTYKTKYRVANWAAYNQALVRRGDVTVSRLPSRGTVKFSGRVADLVDETRRAELPRIPLPLEIISHAVWLYHRFGVSFRDVEDLLAQRGITVSYEAIRLWCLAFGSAYARRLKRRQGRLGATPGTWTRPSSPSRDSGAISGVPSIEMAMSSISSSSRVTTAELPHAFSASC